MTTNQIGENPKTPRGLGFGFGFETHDRYGISGWGGAYGAYYRVDPQERLVTVLMYQMMPNTTDLTDKFKASVYQAIVK